MTKLLVLYRREMAAYFNTPIAYIFIPVFVGLLAYFFLKGSYPFFLASSAEMRSFFSVMPLALVFFAPALTIRLWSDELRVGTAEILLTLPYKVSELVVAKFLAAYSVLAVSLLLTLGIPAAVAWAGDPDWGPIVCGYIGALLMGGVFIALGGFVSSNTQNQVVALLFSLLAALLLVWVFSPQLAVFLPADWRITRAIVEMVGVESHYVSFERGTLELRDVIYFVSVTVFFLALNVFRVASRRY